jgi:hypothetical protein
MSRGGSRRGGDRSDHPPVAPDGWAVAGGSGPPRPPPKAGDLSNFGKINKTQQMTFGPSSVFAGKKGAESKREAISRTSSSSNMFSMLSSQAPVSGKWIMGNAAVTPSMVDSDGLAAPDGGSGLWTTVHFFCMGCKAPREIEVPHKSPWQNHVRAVLFSIDGKSVAGFCCDRHPMVL